MKGLDTPKSDIEAPKPKEGKLKDESAKPAATLMGPPQTFDVTMMDGKEGKEIQVSISEKNRIHFDEAIRLGFEFYVDGETVQLFRRGKEVSGKFKKGDEALLITNLTKALEGLGEQNDDAYTREAERLLNMKPQTAFTRTLAMMFRAGSKYGPMFENFSSIGFSNALDRFPYNKEGQLSDQDKEVLMKGEMKREKDLRNEMKDRVYPPTYTQQRKSVSYVRETLWGKNDIQDYHSLAGKLKRSLIPNTGEKLLDEELAFSDFVDREKPFGTTVFFLLEDKMLTGFINENKKLEYFDGKEVKEVAINGNANAGSSVALNASTFRAAYLPLGADRVRTIAEEHKEEKPEVKPVAKTPEKAGLATVSNLKVASDEADKLAAEYMHTIESANSSSLQLNEAEKLFPAAWEQKEDARFAYRLMKEVGLVPETKESLGKAIKLVEDFIMTYHEEIDKIELKSKPLSFVDEAKLKVSKRKEKEMAKRRNDYIKQLESLAK